MEMEMEVEDGAAEVRVEEEMWSGGAQTLLELPPGSCVSIGYHSDFGSHHELFLVEVDDSVLPHVLHNRVTIRGQIDEEAVLCTPSSTYGLKFVGTSNSVFLLPPGDASGAECEENELGKVSNSMPVVSILKVAPGNMELVQVAPKLDKLQAILKERPYRLEEEEDMVLDTNGTHDLYRWEDLTNLIQASDGELMEGLKALSALEINGFWRTVDEKVMDDILKMILNNSIIYDWSLNSIREDEVLSRMEEDGFSRRMVCHCLSIFGKEEFSDGIFVWSIDAKKLSVQFARQILKGGKMKLENFKEKWELSLPSQIHADLQFLEGEVLYEKLGIETWIYAFSVSTLPLDPAERFAMLFRERPKWEGRDLQPYIRDLRVPGLPAESLLIKYTRRTQPTGDTEPIFSPR